MSNNETTKKITSANREAWEEAAPIHYQQNQTKLLEAVSKPGYSCLDDVETERLIALDVVGKDVAQICCNNARELISVKNMGAARCVGFDVTQGFINHGEELAKAAGLDIEFVCTDIYDIDDKYTANFDLVTITIGAITWMPDIDGFFAVVAKLLRPDGAVFIYDQHPILNMIEPDDADAPIVWELSYFDKEPYVETGGLDYWSGKKYDAKPATSFSYTMGEMIMAGIHNNLAVEYIEELPRHISNTWWNVEKSDLGFPMSFTLVMRKA